MFESRWDISRDIGSGALPQVLVAPIDGAEMVLVPAGEFVMGTTQEELRQIFLLDQRETPVFLT